MMLNEQAKGINLVHGDDNLSHFHLSAALQQPLVHLSFFKYCHWCYIHLASFAHFNAGIREAILHQIGFFLHIV